MAQWDPHPLAPEQREQLRLKVGARVRAVVDLPGVPTGTEGKVLVVAGFQWLRYRILFDNRVELAHLDARHIEPLKKKRSA